MVCPWRDFLRSLSRWLCSAFQYALGVERAAQTATPYLKIQGESGDAIPRPQPALRSMGAVIDFVESVPGVRPSGHENHLNVIAALWLAHRRVRTSDRSPAVVIARALAGRLRPP